MSERAIRGKEKMQTGEDQRKAERVKGTDGETVMVYYDGCYWYYL